MASERDFTWRDGERTVVFRAGVFADAPDLLDQGIWGRFELLTTPRALGAASVELGERSSAVHQVPGGPVPEAATALIDTVRNPTLVALGGGRVIDTAKAIAAVRGGRVCAMPTTLSGAEMTTIHRLPAGREGQASHLVRPTLVIADPIEMTTLDDRRLRASAMNALAHGAEALYGPRRNPVASLAGARGAELIAAGDRALGSLLCAYAVDSAGYALHHVLCQTIVRIAATPHADTNAAMLPLTMAAMLPRAPQAMAELGAALAVAPEAIPARIVELSGGASVDVDRDLHERIADTALARPELRFTPAPEVTREELLGLLAAAASL